MAKEGKYDCSWPRLFWIANLFSLFFSGQVLPYDTGSPWLKSLMNKLNIWTVNDVTTNNQQNGVKKTKENVDVVDNDSDCDKYLKDLDPAEWKEQDHYRCMGLSKKRFYATENEIKKQCKFWSIL